MAFAGNTLFLAGGTVGRVTLAVGLALTLGLSSAQAQQPTPAQTSAIRANCRSDFMANCSGVQPGGKDALECLKRNLARLSGGCQAAVSAISPAPSAAPPAAVAAPAPPPAASAPAAPVASAPAAPTVSKPLAAKPAPAAKAAVRTQAAVPPVTPPPVAAAPAAPAVQPLVLRPMLPRRRMVIMAICRGDAERLCRGLPPIGPEVLDCLAVKAANLSPTCYEALARVSRE